MGTTSEELKKLYAKLGGKDPKVAGFSAPGEILNAINEIPLPTEYELPTVTTEDAGDVLVVNDEGKWDKGEAGSGVTPNPEGEATVDLTKLGIDDTVYGIPKELPAVTTDDNGDVLSVVEGAWAKAAPSGCIWSKYTVEVSGGAYGDLGDNKTFGDIKADYSAGKMPFIINSYGMVFYLVSTVSEQYVFATYIYQTIGNYLQVVFLTLTGADTVKKPTMRAYNFAPTT